MNSNLSIKDPFWDWHSFESNYLLSKVPHRIVVSQKPKIEFYTNSGAGEFGAHFGVPKLLGKQLNINFREIEAREIKLYGENFVELSIGNTPLFSSFFSLLREITSDILEKKTSPLEAIRSAIGRWEALIARSNALSHERQVGLFGEVWLLKRLIPTLGASALAAWVGPLELEHDFRIGDTEFEVKSTSSSRRVHRINGAGQLTPSVGCELNILSLQLTNAGSGGQTLPQLVDSVEELLRAWPGEDQRFLRLLEKAGFDRSDAPLYQLQLRLRNEAKLIPVVDGVPRLTDEAIKSLDARYCPNHILRVAYDIDVSDMGYPDGSVEFLQVIPAQP